MGMQSGWTEGHMGQRMRLAVTRTQQGCAVVQLHLCMLPTTLPAESRCCLGFRLQRTAVDEQLSAIAVRNVCCRTQRASGSYDTSATFRLLLAEGGGAWPGSSSSSLSTIYIGFRCRWLGLLVRPAIETSVV